MGIGTGGASPYEQNASQGDYSDPSVRMTAGQKLRLALPTAGELAPEAMYDPRFSGMQDNALAQLSNEVASGGWSPEERAGYERLQAQSAGTAAGQRAGVAASLAAKGVPAGLANRIAGEMGQQQDTTTGNLLGIAGQQAADRRAYAAAQALASGAQTAGDQSAQESMFQAGQVGRGALSRYAMSLGQMNDQQMMSDQARSMQAQAVGEGIQGGAQLIGGLAKAGNTRRGGGSTHDYGWGDSGGG